VLGQQSARLARLRVVLGEGRFPTAYSPIASVRTSCPTR
jgi:hypothetical protein